MFENAMKSALLSAAPMLIIFLVVLIVVRISSNRGKSRLVIHNEIMNLLFVIYILLLFELLTGTENSLGSGFNIVPFQEIFRYQIGSKMFNYNVLGNILLFMPFGYFVSRLVGERSFATIFIDALITSFTIELVQLKVGRSFDIDDIMLNVIGAIVGYFLYVGLDAIKNHLPRFLQKDFIYDILCIIILGIFILYMLKVVGIWTWRF